MLPRVSVLIPCYNAEDFIGDAIESALCQSHTNIEVVVVDDGSTDDSVRVLETFGDRIRFEAGPNQGACMARNRALELSSGSFVQYLDADDLLCPTKIETQLEPLRLTQVDLVFCQGYIFGDGKPERPKKRVIRDPQGSDPFVYCLSQGLATEGPLIRRSLIERVGGFTSSLRRGQEWDFHVRLAAAGARLYYIPQLLYRHRHDDRPGRITKRPLDASYFTSHLIDLGRQLQTESCYSLTRERAIAYASVLVSAGVGAFRDGDRQLGAESCQLALQIDPSRSFNYPGGAIYRVLCRMLGVSRTESVLNPVRHVRDAISRRSHNE